MKIYYREPSLAEQIKDAIVVSAGSNAKPLIILNPLKKNLVNI